MTERAMLLRVVGSVGSISLPTMVPSMDSELSSRTMILAVVPPVRKSGYCDRGSVEAASATGSTAIAARRTAAERPVRSFIEDSIRLAFDIDGLERDLGL